MPPERKDPPNIPCSTATPSVAAEVAKVIALAGLGVSILLAAGL